MAVTNAIPEMEREIRFFPVENPNPRKLTRGQIRQFNEKGYLFPLDVFTPEEAAANRRYFDQLMAAARAAGHNSIAQRAPASMAGTATAAGSIACCTIPGSWTWSRT